MYKSNAAAKAFLRSVMKYLGERTYSDNGKGLQMGQWFINIGDARDILRDRIQLLTELETVKNSPVGKATVGFIETPDATIVVIDGDRLEREVLKASIADSDVQKLLPFNTVLKAGDTKIHIVNASAYTVETNYHLIGEGESLCARGKSWDAHSEYDIKHTYARTDINRHTVPTCPGCLAKAKNVIVTHLLKTPNLIR